MVFSPSPAIVEFWKRSKSHIKIDFRHMASVQTGGKRATEGADAIHAPAAAATMLRCITCGVQFAAGSEDMRKHYTSDWHQHNVRLRVAGQPPVRWREFVTGQQKASQSSRDSVVGVKTVTVSVAATTGSQVAVVGRHAAHPAAAAAAAVPPRQAVASGANHDPEGSRDDDDEDAVPKAPIFTCKLCKKTFHSVQTLQSHVRSTEHLMRKEARILARDSQAGSMISNTSLGSAAIGLHRRHKTHQRERLRLVAATTHADPMDTAAPGGEVTANATATRVPPEERELDVSEDRCFFCGLASPAMTDNMRHMLSAHNFAIPLVHRCTDISGLMRYLARKVNGLVCFVCGEKTRRFTSLEALRNHMREQQHDRVVLSPEYDEFYAGGLDDGSEARIAAEVNAEGQLVVRNGDKTIIGARSGGYLHAIKQRHESIVEREERRAITNAAAEAQQVMVRERLEAMAPAMKEHQKLLRQERLIRQKADMQNGVRNNKLHPKGFDGEGERI